MSFLNNLPLLVFHHQLMVQHLVSFSIPRNQAQFHPQANRSHHRPGSTALIAASSYVSPRYPRRFPSSSSLADSHQSQHHRKFWQLQLHPSMASLPCSSKMNYRLLMTLSALISLCLFGYCLTGLLVAWICLIGSLGLESSCGRFECLFGWVVERRLGGIFLECQRLCFLIIFYDHCILAFQRFK